MWTLLTILLTILGWTAIAKFIIKLAPEEALFRTSFDMLNIKYDKFDSTVYPGYTGLYIEDKHFNDTILYFDSKGKLQTK